MKRPLILFVLALASLVGVAQLAPVNAPDPGTPVTTMRASHLYIDNVFPTKRIGLAVTAETDQPNGGSFTPSRWPGEALGVVARNGGAFRIFSARSHFAYDDPIVYPGQKGKSHLHVFFGNTLTSGVSTPTTIRTTGNSTSAGGTHNRSAYWVPAMIYVCDSADKIAIGCDASRNGSIVDPLFTTGLNVYYKGSFGTGGGPEDFPGASGTWWQFNHDVESFPVGFRMIAGNPANITEAGVHHGMGFQCRIGVPESESGVYPYIPGTGVTAGAPTTAACNTGVSARIIMVVPFPSCGADTIDLDSPTHNTHIVDKEQRPQPPYDSGDFECPTGFTHPYPGVEYKLHYDISTSQLAFDSQFWRLSSDRYDTALPAGYSIHGDWFNGWDPAIMALWVANCIVRGVDCHDGVLGPATAPYDYTVPTGPWRVLDPPKYSR